MEQGDSLERQLRPRVALLGVVMSSHSVHPSPFSVCLTRPPTAVQVAHCANFPGCPGKIGTEFTIHEPRLRLGEVLGCFCLFNLFFVVHANDGRCSSKELATPSQKPSSSSLTPSFNVSSCRKAAWSLEMDPASPALSFHALPILLTRED